jgi:hypothetical protein
LAQCFLKVRKYWAKPELNQPTSEQKEKMFVFNYTAEERLSRILLLGKMVKNGSSEYVIHIELTSLLAKAFDLAEVETIEAFTSDLQMAFIESNWERDSYRFISIKFYHCMALAFNDLLQAKQLEIEPGSIEHRVIKLLYQNTVRWAPGLASELSIEKISELEDLLLKLEQAGIVYWTRKQSIIVLTDKGYTKFEELNMAAPARAE